MLADIDHVVLWVSDPIRSLSFYRDIVGLEIVREVEFREGKAPFPSARLGPAAVIDLMPTRLADTINAVARSHGLTRDAAGKPANHVCLAVSQADYRELRERLAAAGVDVSFGAREGFGARGSAAESFYFPDPDENVLEVRHYPTA